MSSSTQILNQQICQKFGWSCEFGTIDGGYDSGGKWFVEVVVGIGDKRRYTSPSSPPSSEPPKNKEEKKKREREEKEIVSKLAIEGLKDCIAIEDAKEVTTLTDVFSKQQLTIVDSANSKTWDEFWKSPPSQVGIDVEGNQISPPVLVQIATDDYTILDVPKKKQLSKNLQRLLADDDILKIFCDNFSHKDKVCLGIMSPPLSSSSKNKNYNNKIDANKDNNNTTPKFLEPPIIDIEELMIELFGPVKVPRGLSKIVSLLAYIMPEFAGNRNIRIAKPKNKTGKMKGRYSNVGRYAMIEQGKAKPLKGISDLSKEEQHYAALDAWCTLKAYQSLVVVAKNPKAGTNG